MIFYYILDFLVIILGDSGFYLYLLLRLSLQTLATSVGFSYADRFSESLQCYSAQLHFSDAVRHGTLPSGAISGHGRHLLGCLMSLGDLLGEDPTEEPGKVRV